MKNFTIVKQLACLMLLLVGAVISNAQTNAMVLKIASPAGASGTYGLLRSSFGNQDVNEELGKSIILATPAEGCTPITNSLTGSIAFVDRGNCEFTEKVQSAQNAGAIVVMICNNDGDLIAPGPGTINDGSKITVKSFMMEKSDCERIKVALAAGAVSADLVVRQCEPVPPANAIWGADFDGGLNGWNIDTEEGKGWGWTADGDCIASFMPNPCNMNTPTICNGAVAINSNELDVSGACQATCPSSVFSPNIDLSTFDVKGLTLQFNQSIREFGSTYYIVTSYDDGATWPDSIELNRDVFSNDAYNGNMLVKVGLCNVPLDAKTIRLQFFIQANYYFWGIDDVFLINEPAFGDPQTNNNFWATAPALRTPVSQATSFPLLSDIRNNGCADSPNTVLTAKVFSVAANGAQGAELATQSFNYGTVRPIEPDSFLENRVFDNLYNEPTTIGRYRINYTIASDNNKLKNNDTRTSDFFMTENIFSNGQTEKEFGRAYLGRWNNGVNGAFVGANTNFWSIGTGYHYPKGSQCLLKEFRFGVDTITATGVYSASITCDVFKIINNDTDAANLVGTERVLVGKGISPDDGSDELFIDNTTPNRRRSRFLLTNLDGSNEGRLRLEDNATYVFVLNIRSFSGTNYFPVLGYNPNSSNTQLRWGYTEATNLGYGLKGINYNVGTVVSRGATDTDIPAERSLATNFFKRLYSEVLGDFTTNTEDQLEETALSVYPNPAANEVFVDLNLNKVSKNVKVELFDVTGKKAISQSFENVRTESLKISLASINTGVYVAKITTDEGFITKKVLVTK